MTTTTKTHVQRAIEVLDLAGLGPEWSNTGGGCHAIVMDFGDWSEGDYSQILVTDGGENGDVYTNADYYSDDEVSDGRFFVGCYSGDGDMIDEDGVEVGLDELAETCLRLAAKHYGFETDGE